MKIYDEALENELTAPDLELGRLEPARRLVAHHEAEDAVWHYETMPCAEHADCPKDLRQIVIDTPARAAWDEYEDVQRYVPYTEEELAEREADKAAAEEKAAAEAAREEKIARIDSIDAQVTYTAMMTDTLMEVDV